MNTIYWMLHAWVLGHVDQITALLELTGGLILWFNVRRMWNDRQVAGVSIFVSGFYTLWGYWNLLFYPIKDMWYSWRCAIIVALANTTWFAIYWWSKHHPKGEKQYTYVHCDCGVELTKDPNTQRGYYGPDELVMYKCGGCGTISSWDFDAAPVPLRVE